MNRRMLLALSLLALVPEPARATPGTCTIVPNGVSLVAHVPSAGDFVFPLGSADGTAIPVDVDAATGSFRMMRGGLPEVTFDTQGGPVVLVLAGPDAVGTIDAAGNAALPNFNVRAIFGGTIELPTNPTLSTGVQSKSVAGEEFPTQGAALDFASGVVTLVGGDVIPSAPIVEEPVITELHLSCHLAPIPDQATLPAAPGAKAVGKAKLGSDADGDSVRMKAKLTPGSVPFDFAGSDLFVRITAPGGADVLLVLVRAGAMKARGKKFSAEDEDGSTIQVLAGHAPAPAPLGGSIAITNGKKRAALSLHLVGLDLSALADAGTVTVTVGTSVAATNVTVRSSTKKKTFR
jgi:hypothetical protein